MTSFNYSHPRCDILKCRPEKKTALKSSVKLVLNRLRGEKSGSVTGIKLNIVLNAVGEIKTS